VKLKRLTKQIATGYISPLYYGLSMQSKFPFSEFIPNSEKITLLRYIPCDLLSLTSYSKFKLRRDLKT
jgi:hypothetical protein